MEQTARNEEHLALLRGLGVSSLLYAPLTGQGRVSGALALFMSDPLRRFSEEDQDIAVEIARRASLALENARLYSQANAAVQARDEFLSIASHELRTPVTAISGVAQVALRSHERGTLDDARLTRALGQIMRGSRRLVTLTEDLLDVSRLQTRRFELRLEPLDLTAFVADFMERFGSNLGEQHQLRLETDGEGRSFQVDPARFEQVLSNLLSNAVKYTRTVARSWCRSSTSKRVARAARGSRCGMRASACRQTPRRRSFSRSGVPKCGSPPDSGARVGAVHLPADPGAAGGRIWAESPATTTARRSGLWLPQAPPPVM